MLFSIFVIYRTYIRNVGYYSHLSGNKDNCTEVKALHIFPKAEPVYTFRLGMTGFDTDFAVRLQFLINQKLGSIEFSSILFKESILESEKGFHLGISFSQTNTN